PAVEVLDVLEAALPQVIGDGGAPDPLMAVDDDLVIGVQLIDPQLDLLDRDVHGVFEPTEARLPVLADVEQEGPVASGQTRFEVLRRNLVHRGCSASGAPDGRPENRRASRSPPRRVRSAGSAHTHRPSEPPPAGALRRLPRSARRAPRGPGGRGSAAPATGASSTRADSPRHASRNR